MSLSKKEFIKREVPEAARYELLAEECVELAHACLKKARLLRDENPTPLSMNDVDCMVMEEYADVVVCSSMLGLNVDVGDYWAKIDRWAERIFDANKQDARL